MKISRIVLTCEHGGNRVPSLWRHLFHRGVRVLGSHRGYDIGALPFAKALSPKLSTPPAPPAPLIWSEITRLLVDLNRSPHHPALFSEFTRELGAREKEAILERHYVPYREKVERAVTPGAPSKGAVLHLSIHSFTPIWKGLTRNVDIGLLFDPARPGERDYCALLQGFLKRDSQNLRVRRNAPYRGTADGLTTSLRKKFAADRYLGIEVELSQKLASDPLWRRRFAKVFADAVWKASAALRSSGAN